MSWKRRVSETIEKYGSSLDASRPEGVDLPSMVAIAAVEAGGKALGEYNRPIIRFEVHKFYELCGHTDTTRFDQYFRYDQHTRWKGHRYRISAVGQWWNVHSGNQQSEWNALYTAMQFSNGAFPKAIESASWGLAQIMGFHYDRIGYDTPVDMFKAMFNVDNQIGALTRFIETDTRLLAAAIDKDWRTFARIYNGSGQVDNYSSWISEAYTEAVSQLGE